MTDERGRDDDSVDPSDWLSAQFGSDDEPELVEESSDEPNAPEPNAFDRPYVSDQPDIFSGPDVLDQLDQHPQETSPWAPVSAACPAAEPLPVVPPVAPAPTPPPAFAPPAFAPPPAPPLAESPLAEPFLAEPPLTHPLAQPFLLPASPPATQPDPPAAPAAPEFSAKSTGGVFNWGLTPTGDAGSAANQDAPDTEALTFSEAEAEAGAEPGAEAEAEPDAAFEPEPEPEPETEPEPEREAQPNNSHLLDTQLIDAPSAEVPPDASLAGAQSPDSGVPTVAFSWEGTATELFAPAAPSPSVAEPATELLGGIAGRAVDVGQFANSGSGREVKPSTDAVDALFGGIGSVGVPENTGRIRASAEVPAKATRDSAARAQLVLVWVAVALVALLALAVLFFIGTRVSQLTGAAPVVAVSPSVSMKPSPTPSPTPTVQPVGPVAAGTYKWDALRGGECLAPFDSAWAEKFTVVDCATPHPAQMVFRGTFPGAEVADAPYPGVDALQAQINLLCTAPSVIDLGAAGAYSDIQIAGSFPADEKQWTSGARNYYCFVTRSSGQPLTSSVAVAPAAPAA